MSPLFAIKATKNVTMESGNSVTFTAVPAGTFLPILVTHVTAATATAILALY